MKSLIFTATLTLFLTSCVPISHIPKSFDDGYDSGYATADKECIKLQEKINAYILKIQKDNDRLTAINELSHPFSSFTSPPITGDEPWQK